MPIFLQAADIYRIIQRELPPEEVYPDGPATAYYSTADSYATAQVIQDAYTTQQSIYNNFFPTTADERIGDFETLYFGATKSNGLSIASRQQRLLDKIRTLRRTTPQDVLATVYTIIDPVIKAEIVEYGTGDGGWVLDLSQLEVSTILNEFNLLEVVGPDGCNIGDPTRYGLTASQWARLQAQAYSYEVRIYGYTLTTDERTALDAALNSAEPCRSQHIIIDGLNAVDMIGGNG